MLSLCFLNQGKNMQASREKVIILLKHCLLEKTRDSPPTLSSFKQATVLGLVS